MVSKFSSFAKKQPAKEQLIEQIQTELLQLEQSQTTVLAIETSCDETAVAIVRGRTVLSSVVSSQIETHQRYGGVVPEVASREHVGVIGDAIAQALAQSGLAWEEVDAIATTCAPGLVGALMVGITAAKTIAMIHDKPFLGVHHLEGHIYASYLSDPNLQPPFLCLLVSGGHTSLIQVRDTGDYVILGKTRDDAAGEAFDKVARLLDLGYPGGPVIDRLAKQGNPKAFALPEGKISLPGGGFHRYDASFSGLKTAVRRLIEKLQAEALAQEGKVEKGKDQEGRVPTADVAASFQFTVVKALVKRAIACASDYKLDTIVVGGGVAANSELRKTLTQVATERGIKVLFPPMQYCTDNAAMIACAGVAQFDRGARSPLTLGAQSKLPLTDISELYVAGQKALG
ncbi:tRNA (adenosine(37)-N6)-threonylcarbamoyltransferase complex transferase subunit TsaD [cf. Phormidesmis sp. LEGE 11477]|uniref:tRNA (adenosine(37)-N6)-threonylcarbamoyltransferase complex transferase subunit TsaD n=1 Tax=cf. Phormidesmis sp. LEGE 11477 TaxID=1828680 RepID=UPI0018817B81|nr:tRNA (adenosine(37)-N6)-threonylcarbamoyltransferase complex transferase subunit TsaD [cf. Phormidesmis sp. LEGE 11477]MBE9059986.1 tRNA (adenosine(37)-N6)-threonylcarbamoyltransferase complex transferase subunit TsaD [cf. Phormidesmis sp. LEGE 11477]